MSGPLETVRVVELAGLGPGPFCGMILADLGADVVRVDRASGSAGAATPTVRHDVTNRGKRSIAVDLKHPEGVAVVLDLIGTADALIEGFRPGVTERMGVGPAECLARNPRLVYGRMTGWGQEGPMAAMAGHDIDYIALSGALHSIGTAETPVPPLNLVGDFGGGAMLLAVGILAALIHARESGEGQVVDTAMVDGSALLMASHHGFVAEGWWDPDDRGSNLLDGGAPFYSVYATSDGEHMAVGALEPKFFDELIERLGLTPEDVPAQLDRNRWADMRRKFAEVFASKTREDWMAVFSGSDACVAPVMSMGQAPSHEHNVARGTFTEIDGVIQPAPAPRFSSTPAVVEGVPSAPGEDTDSILASLGYTPERVGKLRKAGAVA